MLVFDMFLFRTKYMDILSQTIKLWQLAITYFLNKLPEYYMKLLVTFDLQNLDNNNNTIKFSHCPVQ